MLTEPGMGSASGQGPDAGQNPRSVLRNPFLYTSILLIVALIYVGWIFFARWQAARDLEEQRKAKQAAEDAKTVESLGGNRFEILGFYASPGLIRRGDSADLCYGVSNAKTVRIEPPVGEVWPSLSRCLQISPKRDTTYTFTADDGKGNTKSETLTLTVKP
jgi:hypothetical protein